MRQANQGIIIGEHLSSIPGRILHLRFAFIIYGRGPDVSASKSLNLHSAGSAKGERLRYFSISRSAASLLTISLAGLFLTSCNAGASYSVAQQPLFEPAPGSPITVAAVGNVCVGDMNNDGIPDLVVTTGRPDNVTVLLGRGDGQFRNPASKVAVNENPGDMVLGDVNADRKLDLAFVSHDSYNVTLLLGDGKGGLSAAANSPVVMKEGQHPHTHGLALGDLDRNGKVDLVTVNNSDNDISIALGDGHGNFTRGSATFAVGPSPYPLALGDLNNDGFPDMVATTTATGPRRREQLPFSRALTLLLADGRGGFRASPLPLRTGQPWFVALGDLNGDHKPDLVATHHDQSQLTVLLGDGKGAFTETSSSPFDFGHSAFQVVLADVNRDGKLDALAASGNSVRVMLGDGRGGFQTAPGSPIITGGGTWRIDLGDLNKDGKLDVVTSNSESQNISVLLGR